MPLSICDPEWAKRQLLMLCREWYMHPSGAFPAYEWNFGDVNPPVHAWAALRLFQISKANGRPDLVFLERVFHKLMLNFTWWVNRKDKDGRNVFEGGFLGLDNISVIDRSDPEIKVCARGCVCVALCVCVCGCGASFVIICVCMVLCSVGHHHRPSRFYVRHFCAPRVVLRTSAWFFLPCMLCASASVWLSVFACVVFGAQGVDGHVLPQHAGHLHSIGARKPCV